MKNRNENSEVDKRPNAKKLNSIEGLNLQFYRKVY